MGWLQRARENLTRDRVYRQVSLRGGFYTSRRGVHPPQRKDTSSKAIVEPPGPEVVIIPLDQHIGAPCDPVVEVGERVLLGQKIGDAEAYVSAPIHSSVSGEVTKIERVPHPMGEEVVSVHIVSDGKSEPHPDVRSPGDPMDMSPLEIRNVIRAAGIVGMGGATFPTHVKLSPPEDKVIDTLIINGAECEPYLTADHRMLLEHPDRVLRGAQIIAWSLYSPKIIVAIESNKKDAISAIHDAIYSPDIQVVSIPTRYPQGAEKTLIKTVLGREVPSGKLPLEVGVVVQNVGTVCAIADAFDRGTPLISRVVTVTGSGVVGGGNLRAKIGTRFNELIEYCGGYEGKTGKLIMGGPMMGLAQYTDSVPVVKGTSGILVLREEELPGKEPVDVVCIRCTRCIQVCPMDLLPNMLGVYSDAGQWRELDNYNIDDCVECGCCAYVCPAKIPLVQLIKVGKRELNRMKKRMEEMSGD